MKTPDNVENSDSTPRAPQKGHGRGATNENQDPAGGVTVSMGDNAHESPRNRSGRPWTYNEILTVWQHPDWSAREIAETLLQGRTAKAVERARERYGKYSASHAPVCAKCGERSVWMESAKARRYGLCKECFLTEERLRLEDERRSAAIRQMRHRRKKSGK